MNLRADLLLVFVDNTSLALKDKDPKTLTEGRLKGLMCSLLVYLEIRILASTVRDRLCLTGFPFDITK